MRSMEDRNRSHTVAATNPQRRPVPHLAAPPPRADEGNDAGSGAAFQTKIFQPDYCLLLFEVTSESEPHGREDLVLEEVLALGAEALEERGGQDMRGDSLVIGGGKGPASFA